MKIGFIGVGTMGRPMAGHLQSAGHELLLVKHRAALPAELVDAGAASYPNRKALAADADVVILMVPDTPDVEDALFGVDGVAEGLAPGKIVIDMSSIDPIATRGFAERVEALGADYVDAPVSGGEVGAMEATLTIMVGAREEVFVRVEPLFACMGKRVSLIGDVGAGQVAKVANQIIVALTIGAVGEALLFASRAGADPTKVREALIGGFAYSRILEVHGERMIERSFEPGFRIELHDKDLGLALEGAHAMALPLPQTALCRQLLSAAKAAGDGALDHSALVKTLERLALHEIGQG